jgi:hypothetical protein
VAAIDNTAECIGSQKVLPRRIEVKTAAGRLGALARLSLPHR